MRYAIEFLLCLFIAYAAGALLTADFNILEWSYVARGLWLFVALDFFGLYQLWAFRDQKVGSA